MKLALVLLILLPLSLSQETLLSPISFSGNPGDFGTVAVSGDWLVVGDRFESSFAGGAYLYDCGSLNCVEMTRLAPDVPENGEQFGRSVGIQFPWVAVGAPTYSGERGRVVLFDCSNGTSCDQAAVLLSPDPEFGGFFGSALSFLGSLLAVGAENAATTGKVDLFECGTLPCQPIREIFPQDPNYRSFGQSLSLSGASLLVGAPSTASNRGAASFFDCQTDPCQEVTLPVSNTSSFFGNSVSLDGNVAAIGAWRENNFAGAAYLFLCTPTACNQEAKIVPSPDLDSGFAISIGINGERLVIGARGRSRVALFVCPSPDSCALNETFAPSNGEGNFGTHLALGDSLLAMNSGSPWGEFVYVQS